MADEEDQVDSENKEQDQLEDELEEGKGGKKRLLMILVPLLLLIGGGAGAYFTGMLDSLLGVEEVEEGDGEDHGEEGHDKDKKENGKEKDGHAKGKDKKGHGGKKKDKKGKEKGGKDEKDGGEYGQGDDTAFLAIPTIIVNLNTDDENPRYLRLTVQLELEDASEKEAVKAVIPRVIDQFQTYLRELRVRDLRGSAGIYRLQMELLWRVNQATAPVEIKDVLFQEILIQ